MRYVKGITGGRRAYDKRRRQNTLSTADKIFKGVVKHDPCGFCGSEKLHDQIAVDHIQPLNASGHDGWDNYAAACRTCNAAKGNKPLLLFMAERT